MNTYLKTQEMVSQGHPDKMTDQISDALLDEYLKGDKDSKVAIEVLVSPNQVILAGEIKSKTTININDVVRKTIVDIGYNDDEFGFNGKSCGIINMISEQSGEINKAVVKEDGNIGSGDQGFMISMSTNETPDYLPLPYYLSRKIINELTYLRKSGSNKYEFLRPDAKSQVTVEYYDNGKPKRVHTVVISTSHSNKITLKDLKGKILYNFIPRMLTLLPKNISDLFDNETIYKINYGGTFTTFGPNSDTGLTGRKIVVDSGFPMIGGGAFSGKDFSKTDRSGAYFARYISKNLVASGIADEIIVEISYVIGGIEPISVNVSTRNKNINLSDSEISKIVQELFSFKPKDIIEKLKLKNPIYLKTASGGHFGHQPYIENGIEYFTWENLDSINIIKEIIQFEPYIHI